MLDRSSGRPIYVNMKQLPSLLVFIAVVVVAGSVIGILTAPGAWYVGLNKPSFNPPNWVFGPVWTALYIMIGIAGWLVWRTEPKSGAMKLWLVQMALNWLWSPVFFTLNRPGLAVFVIVALLAAIVAFIAAARDVDARASWLFMPYAAWVAFASVLNFSIWWLN